MADEEHLAILKQAAVVWNRWREAHPDVVPDLSEANLNWANLREADLSGANLGRARLRCVIFFKSELREADLRGADLRRGGLAQADLRGADLGGADLHGVDFRGADLRGANLQEAVLLSADLRGADLRGARLEGAEVGSTTFEDNDLSEVEGLDRVIHRGPSTVGTDTIYNSRGRIPEAFLRGAGVPQNLIERMPALVSDPGQFYGCFISYSSKDRAFAERLYADLQARGVRCWFAPEDLKVGTQVRPVVDASTRMRDKLLLVLSAHAVESEWVVEEVEAAFQEERRRKQTVLFPVRLDGAVLNADSAWAAHILRTRPMGDFEGWDRDAEKYDDAFDRLLGDLRVAEAGEG